MRRRREDVGDVVVVAELGAGHALATAALGAEGVGGDGLRVALRRQRDDQLLVVDEVLDVHVAGVEGDLGLRRSSANFLPDLGELVLDHRRAAGASSARIASSSAIVARSSADARSSSSTRPSRVSWPRSCRGCARPGPR